MARTDPVVPLSDTALVTERLVLVPRTAAHADAMFALLSDPALHRHLDEPAPASVEFLRDLYARGESRRSPDGSEHWLNWIVCADSAAIGFVQATVLPSGSAWIAYLLAADRQHRGHATEAVAAMIDHLVAAYRVRRLLAQVDVDNTASIRLLARVGFRAASGRELVGHPVDAGDVLFVRPIRSRARSHDDPHDNHGRRRFAMRRGGR